jgi:hypothetical protein
MDGLKRWFGEFSAEAREWAVGRWWPLRALLMLYFAYVLVRHLGSAEYNSWFGGINLGIHELGHVIFSPFGTFIGILGGSFWQVAVPLLSFWVFRRQGDFFAHSVSACWLGTSLFNLAAYIGDARAQELPLVSPFGGEEIIHDWYYLLSVTGLAPFDQALAFLVRALAFGAMAAGLAWGGWLISVMAGASKRLNAGT